MEQERSAGKYESAAGEAKRLSKKESIIKAAFLAHSDLRKTFYKWPSPMLDKGLQALPVLKIYRNQMGQREGYLNQYVNQ